MLTCKETSVLLSLSRDRPLRWSERLGMRLHLWICAQCRRFERQLKWFGQLAQAVEHAHERIAETDVRLPEPARQRIRNAIEAHPSSQYEGDVHRPPE